jgi:methylated-DNA-[protein]-cysteine S-methyltransferase
MKCSRLELWGRTVPHPQSIAARPDRQRPGRFPKDERNATPRSTLGGSVKKYVYKEIASPVGALKLVASDDGLAAILWERDDPRRVPLTLDREDPSHPTLRLAERQLREYFAGTRRAFDLPLDFVGTTFQRKVWHALLTIPFGETRTYRDIARQIDHPTAVRAVGFANGRNPLSIIAPCHRVLGASGHLTGFAGGLEAKAYLLGLEKSGGPDSVAPWVR